MQNTVKYFTKTSIFTKPEMLVLANFVLNSEKYLIFDTTGYLDCSSQMRCSHNLFMVTERLTD